MGILALEMEAHALYLTAARAGVKAQRYLPFPTHWLQVRPLVPTKENRDLKKWCLAFKFALISDSLL